MWAEEDQACLIVWFRSRSLPPRNMRGRWIITHHGILVGAMPCVNVHSPCQYCYMYVKPPHSSRSVLDVVLIGHAAADGVVKAGRCVSAAGLGDIGEERD
jgi:hypothetical protein